MSNVGIKRVHCIFKNLGRHTHLKETGKKEMLALEVFGESIRYLKDHALRQLGMAGDQDIQWVLTVPAIWDDSARQFMRLAAERVCSVWFLNILSSCLQSAN